MVVANWKMNNSPEQSRQLCSSILSKMSATDKEVILAPSHLCLSTVVESTGDSVIKVAAQNCHQKTSGAYTGETSLEMLKSVGVTHVILGHSERREYFNENSEYLKFDLRLS